jgi:hypothetical protein
VAKHLETAPVPYLQHEIWGWLWCDKGAPTIKYFSRVWECWVNWVPRGNPNYKRWVEVQYLGDGTFRVATYVVVNSTPMMERKTEGISTIERAKEIASQYKQELVLEDS